MTTAPFIKEGTTCGKCGFVIKYIYCDDCNDFHSDIHDPKTCDCTEHFNAEPGDMLPR